MEKINRVSPSLAALGAARSCVPVRVLTSLTSCSLCLSFATLALARISQGPEPTRQHGGGQVRAAALHGERSWSCILSLSLSLCLCRSSASIDRV